MANIPTPIKAALGLAATALDEARKLPETLPQVPVVAISTAMQASLRVQQHIAALATRGEEVLSQLRGTSAEPPSWATFDDSPAEPVGGPAGNGRPAAAFDKVVDAPAAGAKATKLPAKAAKATKPAKAVRAVKAEPVKAAEPAKTVQATKIAKTVKPVKTAGPARAAEPAGGAKTVKPVKTAGPARAGEPVGVAKTVKPVKTAGPARAGEPVRVVKAAKPAKAVKRSEPLKQAAAHAKPSDTPNPATMAAEILQARQAESE